MRSCSISAAPDDQASEDYFRRHAIVPNHGIAPSGKNTHRRHRDGSIDLAQGRKPKTDRIHPMDMAVDPRFLRLGLDLNGSLVYDWPSKIDNCSGPGATDTTEYLSQSGPCGMMVDLIGRQNSKDLNMSQRKALPRQSANRSCPLFGGLSGLRQ